MGTTKRIRIANDNAPIRLKQSIQTADSTEYAVPPIFDERPSPRPQHSLPDILGLGKNLPQSAMTGSLKLSMILWLAALALISAIFLIGSGAGIKTFASLVLLWAGLWNSYVSADHGRWRVSEISVITALAGLMGAVTTTANFFGLGLTLADGLMLMSVLPLLIAVLLKSRICVLASICASLIWAALSFTGVAETSPIMMAFPAIWAAQIYMSTKIKSGLAITLAVLTGYYWAANVIFTHWSADNLPLTFAAAALFIIGTAHHRSGKAAEDKKLIGSSVHIYAGWVAAMIGAIGFQSFWLSPELVQASTASLSPEGLGLWKAIIAAGLAIIFCSAVIRYKYSQITLAGIFLVTAAAALIPMMLWFPAWTQKTIAAIPGISAAPTIGIMMGAAILAASFGMILNGIRRHAPIMMGLGILALFAQGYMLLKPEMMTIDNGIIFGASFLCALGIGAAVAGSSLAHQAPAPRFKNA